MSQFANFTGPAQQPIEMRTSQLDRQSSYAIIAQRTFAFYSISGSVSLRGTKSDCSVSDIQAASSRQGIQQLLAKLGYDVSEPLQQTPAALGIAERVHQLIRQIWRVAARGLQPGAPPALEIYWFETTTLTADLRKAL